MYYKICILFSTVLLTVLGCVYCIKVSPPVLNDDNILRQANKCSFLIKSKEDCGSGFMVSRKRGNDTIHFVWTAAHVILNSEITKSVIDSSGKISFVTHYDDVYIQHDIVENGRIVGQNVYTGEIIRFSSCVRGEDLAILQIRKRNLPLKGISFYSKDKIPNRGLPLWHVGSILGKSCFNSTSDGVISSVGRIDDGKIFDQASIPAYNGSSGCGLYLKSTGECVGMVLQRCEAPNIIRYKPVREIEKWATKTNCLWAVYDMEVPSDEEIRETPVRDEPIEIKIIP